MHTNFVDLIKFYALLSSNEALYYSLSVGWQKLAYVKKQSKEKAKISEPTDFSQRRNTYPGVNYKSEYVIISFLYM
jgi:hypothetical protein